MGVRAKLWVLIGVAIAGAVGLVLVLRAGDAPRIAARIALPEQPAALSVGDGAVFVAEGQGGVLRIDPAGRRVRELPVRNEDTTNMVNAFGSVWVADYRTGTVLRIGAGTGRALERIDAHRHPLSLFSGLTGVAGGEGYVVTSAGDGVLGRISPGGRLLVSDRLYRRNPRPDLSDVAVGHGSVWATDGGHDRVFEVDLRSLVPRRQVHVGRRPVAVASGSDAIWVANQADGTVSRIDPAGSPGGARSIRVGGEPTDIAVDGRSVWVAVGRRDEVVRIDARSGRVSDRISVGIGLRQLAVGEGSVWAIQGIAGVNQLVRIEP